MRYGSVCSGIEAASVAWHPLGWRASFLSEIEAFPRAVLQHHYPTTPLHGDFTTIKAAQYEPIDLLVGGTPCQSFSVAGLRGGLADERGNLALEYLRLAQRLRPRWLVWENVPGVLSSNGGRDFGSILGGLVELGYGFAYRVLNAQFFGVPQRRRRVFVVGCAGDWRSAAAVLFERHSLQGHPAPSREAGAFTTQTLTRSLGAGGADDNRAQGGFYVPFGPGGERDIGTCLTRHAGRYDLDTETFVAAYRTAGDGAVSEEGDCTAPLTTGTDPSAQVVAFACKDSGADASDNPSPTLRSLGAYGANGGSQMAVATPAAVRRLTPRECERLQGFPDDYTLIPWRGRPAGECPDGPRYKALGNSMAVPVMAWIGRRIQQVDDMLIAREVAA